MIGGGLIAFFAWPSIFLFMGAVGVAVFLSIWFGLPETGVRDPEALQIRSMGRTYALLGSSRTFMLYTLAGVGPYLGLFAVLTDIAPVLIGAMGLTPPQFGVLFAVIMIGNLVASVAAGRLVARLGINRLILVGSSTCLVASLVGFMVTNAGYISPMPIVLTASAFMIGFALVMPAVTAGAMSPFPGLAGRASSLMGIIHYGTATLTALMLGLVADGSHRPLMIALLVGGVLALAGYLAILRGIRKSG
jgi:DHA1 family bicyclomycin/chloramphenicol resistance-like MFS transporter